MLCFIMYLLILFFTFPTNLYIHSYYIFKMTLKRNVLALIPGICSPSYLVEDKTVQWTGLGGDEVGALPREQHLRKH